MKFQHTFAILFATFALAAAPIARAQTPAPLNLPTNIFSNLEQEQFGLSIGAVTDGDGVRNATTLDYSFAKNFFARGELQISTGSQFVDSLGLGGGFAKTWPAVRLYAFAEGRRSFTLDEWQGVLGAGIAYQPLQDGILAKFSLFTEPRLVTSFNGKLKTEPPHREIDVGLRYSF